MAMYVCMAISLAAASAGVRVFSSERIIYWREVSNNHSLSAYYVGKNISVLYRLAIAALHFAMVYTLLGQPYIGFGEFYLIIYLLFIATYGMASMVAMVVSQSAPLVAVVFALVSSVFNGYVNSLP